MRSHLFPFPALLLGSLLAPTVALHAQIGTALGEQKISTLAGGFTGSLEEDDYFGVATASLGDLDGDGVTDLAVGAYGDDDGGNYRGAVWILFLATDGTVKSHQKISDTAGGFTGSLKDGDYFGIATASLGDLDGDGVTDLAVGAYGDDDGGGTFNPFNGAVWILFLKRDGTVKSEQKISATKGGFMGGTRNDGFGYSVASLGDVNGDGIGDLAVGAPFDGSNNEGALWILRLNSDGTVKSHRRITEGRGGFSGVLGAYEEFGYSVASLGDLDGDGQLDLAVGAPRGFASNGFARGAVWVLFLDQSERVVRELRIALGAGGFTGYLGSYDYFGSAVAGLGDLDGDGIVDLGVGAPSPNAGGKGSLWNLFLRADGTVQGQQEITGGTGGLQGTLREKDEFGRALAFLGDIDGDGFGDVAVGAAGDNDGGEDHGAAWILSLQGCVPPSTTVRNGLGINPMTLTSPSSPRIGVNWNALLDCSAHAPGLAVVIGRSAPLSGVVTPFGEILVTGGLFFFFVLPHAGTPVTFTVPVPNNVSLCNLSVYAQGACTGSPRPRLSNSLDLVVGR